MPRRRADGGAAWSWLLALGLLTVVGLVLWNPVLTVPTNVVEGPVETVVQPSTASVGYHGQSSSLQPKRADENTLRSEPSEEGGTSVEKVGNRGNPAWTAQSAQLTVPSNRQPSGKASDFAIVTSWRANAKASGNWQGTMKRGDADLRLNFECYAQRHGYELDIFTEAEDPPCCLGLTQAEFDAGYWVKPLALRRLIQKRRHKWVFWLDADARFHSLDTTLKDVVKDLADSVHVVVPSESSKECRFSAFAVLIRVGEIGEKFVEDWFQNYKNSCGYNDQCPLWETILQHSTQAVSQLRCFKYRAQSPDKYFNKCMHEIHQGKSGICTGAAITSGVTYFTPYIPAESQSGLALNCGASPRGYGGNLAGLASQSFIMHKANWAPACSEAQEAATEQCETKGRL
eukprot:TRINITY_DN14295_c0_g1_i3.p1 TRINITY_DN14295_c0_g1~~TRINITY_DN14295_c0_g1_i3.p1  ORF type:complete len:401 (+),score=64.48 TRINITY_DN14295_c0_g1_i3:181-1383(+)